MTKPALRYDIDDPAIRSLFVRHAADPRCASCRVREWSICAGMHSDHHDEIEAIKEDRRFDAGEPLFREGDRAAHVFTLTEGVVRLVRLLPDGRRHITGFLFPGDFFGLSMGETYPCSAEAVTGLRVCRFDRARLDGIGRRHPALEHRFLEAARVELLAAQDQMLLLGRKTAAERIASFILMIETRAVRLHRDRGAETELPMPMTRADIGDFLGLTLETVSRTLSRFTRERLIEAPGARTLRVLDRAAIKVIADGG